MKFRSESGWNLEGQQHHASATTDVFPQVADELLKLSRLEAQLENSLYKALGELQRAQTVRRGAKCGEKSK